MFLFQSAPENKPESKITEIAGKAAYDRFIKENTEQGYVVIVTFGFDACSPCRAMQKELDKILNSEEVKNGTLKVKVGHVDITKNGNKNWIKNEMKKFRDWINNDASFYGPHLGDNDMIYPQTLAFRKNEFNQKKPDELYLNGNFNKMNTILFAIKKWGTGMTQQEREEFYKPKKMERAKPIEIKLR